ncbi:MAG: hypothetical protein JKY65_19690 [Planctomycetes bacterium]|nr:hypothetical protein [Planctomycetota bacterium]
MAVQKVYVKCKAVTPAKAFPEENRFEIEQVGGGVFEDVAPMQYFEDGHWLAARVLSEATDITTISVPLDGVVKVKNDLLKPR